MKNAYLIFTAHVLLASSLFAMDRPVDKSFMFWQAAQKNNFFLMMQMQDASVDVNYASIDEDGCEKTALDFALSHSNVVMVNALCADGAVARKQTPHDILDRYPESKPYTHAYWMAAKNNDVDAMEALFDEQFGMAAVNVNVKISAMSPLDFAIKHDNEKMLVHVLSHSGESCPASTMIYRYDYQASLAFWLEAKKLDLPSMQRLKKNPRVNINFQYRCDPQSFILTPLDIAVDAEKNDIVTWLCQEKAATFKYKRKDDFEPRFPGVKLFLDGRKCNHFWNAAKYKDLVSMKEMMAEYGDDIDVNYLNDKMTALDFALEHGDQDMARFLVSLGARVCQKTMAELGELVRDYSDRTKK